jgi:hypothetical protein
MTAESCSLCDGCCLGTDIAALTSPALRWLWTQVAATADRRGDPALVAGAPLRIQAPEDAEGRAAAVGLLGGRLSAGQRRAVSPEALTARIRRRGPTTGQPVAVRVRKRQQRAARERQILDRLSGHLRAGGGPLADTDPAALADALRRSRLLNYLLDLPNTDRVVEDSVRVLRALPAAGARIDRRLLATEVLADPHGLDEGQPVASVVRALLAAGGLVPAGERPRNAWRAVGVDSDELTGGLGALGIHPVGWRLPAAALVTLPPIELAACQWPAPDEPESCVRHGESIGPDGRPATGSSRRNSPAPLHVRDAVDAGNRRARAAQ